MTRFILILITWLMVHNPPIVSAQEGSLTREQMETKLVFIRNPFKSQLPVKEKTVIKDESVKEIPPKEMKTDSLPAPKKSSTESKTPVVKAEPEEVMPPLPKLVVSGVIWDTARPQAIINGHIINVGDAILQIEITDIRKTEIDGLFHGKPVTIKTQRSSL